MAQAGSAFFIHKQQESRFWSLERASPVRCFGRSPIPKVGRLEQARCFLLQRGERQTLTIVSVPFQNLIGKIKKTQYGKSKTRGKDERQTRTNQTFKRQQSTGTVSASKFPVFPVPGKWESRNFCSRETRDFPGNFCIIGKHNNCDSALVGGFVSILI